jgi:hypothetical protein
MAGDWSTADTERQALVIGLQVADWSQTLYLTRRQCVSHQPYSGDQCSYSYQETGPARFFIGEHPSVGKVNNYFAGTIALNTAIAVLLPPRWRPTFQVGSAAYEAYFVIRNHSIGIKFDF